MTQDEVEKVIKLSSAIKDAHKCLYLLKNRVAMLSPIFDGYSGQCIGMCNFCEEA